MKKRIFAAVMALCLMAGTSAFAQDKKMMPKERPTAEQMAQTKADRMKEKLSLNDAQTKQIYDIKLMQIKQMQTQHEKMKSDRTAEAAKMKGILTPEQYTQWEEMQGQMKMKHGMKGKGDCKDSKGCCKDGKAKGDCKDVKASCCKDGKKCDKPTPKK